MAPSIEQLISHSSIKYSSPLNHYSSLFPYGFNNYQGRVCLDNNVFIYIIRIGKTKKGKLFYDMTLKYECKIKEADTTVPGNKCVTDIKSSFF